MANPDPNDKKRERIDDARNLDEKEIAKCLVYRCLNPKAKRM